MLFRAIRLVVQTLLLFPRVPQHPFFQLTSPIEFVDEAPRLSPPGLRLHIELQENFGSEHLLNLDPGRSADLFQHPAALADEYSLLSLSLAIDRRCYSRQALAFFELLHDNCGGIGNLFTGVEQDLLA